MLPPLILGSASPRRRRILSGLGADFRVVHPEVEEVLYHDDAERTARVNAARKLAWCRERFPDARVLCADTTVEFRGRCVTKPDSLDQAETFLAAFSGQRQKVFTAVALYNPPDRTAVRLAESEVVFRKLDTEAIRRYFALVDPMDKAGGYDIDQHGDLIVARHSGSYTNIVGLPEEIVSDWLRGELPRGDAPPLPPPLQLGAVTIALPVVLAPMAGFTDTAFRSICRELGAGAVFTEVITARGIVHGSAKTEHMLSCSPGERPAAAHIYGSEPEIMAQAAASIQDQRRFDFIDINAGCPVRKVVARGAGAALIRDPARLGRIVQAVAGAVSLPVTVKTRIGFDPGAPNVHELAHAVTEAGAAALIVHARFAANKHAGDADWDTLARLKAECRIPLIGNGGVWRAEDVPAMFARTGVDGVMIGRAAIGNPWVFAQVRDVYAGRAPALPDIAERRRVVREHLERLVAYKLSDGKHRRRRAISAEQGAALHFRAHLFRYLKGCRDWPTVRRSLDALNTPEAVLEMVDRALPAE